MQYNVSGWRLALGLGLSLATASISAQTPLLDAVQHGSAADVKAALKQRGAAQVATADGSTPLMWAAYRTDADMVRAVLRARADVNAKNRYGMTALLQAARTGNDEIVGLLLKAGADPATAVRKGETPLMAAAGAGSVASVTLLLDRGSDVNAHEDEEDQTALMWAAGEGHVEVVKALVAAGADVNLASRASALIEEKPGDSGRQFVDYSRGGLTALMYAAREGRTDVARVLIEAGADLDVRTPDNLTAMLLAVVNDYTDLAALLLDKGANPNDGSLFEAVKVHNLRIGATASDASRPRPDHHNEIEPLELVNRLLDRGADPNRVIPYTLHADGTGVPRETTATAFASALQSQDVAVLRQMLERKLVDPNGVIGNATPLMEVNVGAGRGGLFTGFGEGGFRHPSQRGSVAAATLLIEHGADVNVVTPAGDTALHRAAQNGEVEVLKLLAARGAKLDVKNKAGLSPLDVAMGKQPPGPPREQQGFPGRGGPQPAAIVALRELMGLPPEKTPTVAMEAAPGAGG